jgi:hypothetical protein
MRPALYWVIRFDDGTYEPNSYWTLSVPKRSQAYHRHCLGRAREYRERYRKAGFACRIVRVVRKEPVA